MRAFVLFLFVTLVSFAVPDDCLNEVKNYYEVGRKVSLDKGKTYMYTYQNTVHYRDPSIRPNSTTYNVNICGKSSSLKSEYFEMYRDSISTVVVNKIDKTIYISKTTSAANDDKLVQSITGLQDTLLKHMKLQSCLIKDENTDMAQKVITVKVGTSDNAFRIRYSFRLKDMELLATDVFYNETSMIKQLSTKLLNVKVEEKNTYINGLGVVYDSAKKVQNRFSGYKIIDYRTRKL